MSLRLRRTLLPFAATVGLLGLLTSSGTARPLKLPRGGCGSSLATPTGFPLSSGQSPAPTLKGQVRVHAGRGGWIIEALVGRKVSYVRQRFHSAKGVTVKFCLRAPSGAAARLVGLQPGGISLELRGGYLALRVSRPGKVSSFSHRLLVTGHPIVVELAVNGNGNRVDVYANGIEQASFSGKALAPSSIALGSLVPARASSILLTAVTVATCREQVIPVPARQGRPTAGSAPGSPGATATASPPQGPAGTGAGAGVGTPSSGGTAPSGAGATACGAGAAELPPAEWPGNPFSPTSFWNTPLAADAPLDASSQAYVTELVRQVQSYGPWMNTTSYSTPVYVVTADQPVQHVTVDRVGPDLQAEFDAVPIPCDAKAAAGSDAHMVVWQPSTDKMWEFWKMQQESDGWHANWGGEMDNVSSDPGYFEHTGESTNWGATGTGLPLLGGLVTEADLKRGYINHALAIGLVQTAARYWSWPAQRTDGSSWTPGITPIPEGTRFRLDPTLDVDSLNLPPLDRMLAKAAQTYGIVVRDKAGAVVFYGQDPVNSASNPWPAAFGNQYPNNVLKQFPWSHLQALQTQLSCCWSPSY